MNKNLLVEYLNCRRLPFEQHEGATLLHSAICEGAPDFYLRLLLEPFTDVSHKRAILLNFLSHPALRKFGRHALLTQLNALPALEALSIVEVIREQRINRNRARDLALAFLLGHEQFPTLAATKRQRIIRLLKHALGERTWSSIRRFLNESSEEGETFLQRELLRYARNGDNARARETLNFLAGVEFSPSEPMLTKSLAARKSLEQGEGLPRATLLGIRGIYARDVPVQKIQSLSAHSGTSIRTDGPLTKFYKEAFFEQERSRASTATSAPTVSEPVGREGPFAVLYEAFQHLFTPEAAGQTPLPGYQSEGGALQENEVLAPEQALPDHLAAAIALMPQLPGRLEIVLDLSSSMASSGERLYHPAALALALTRLLQERIHNVGLHYVGGSASFAATSLPLPQGETDIASALLAAAATKPQAILIISDGYENIQQGDTERIVQGLQQLDLTMPIYQIVPVFTPAEKLAQRRFSNTIPLIPLAHEEGVRELLAHMLLASIDNDVSIEEMRLLQQILCVR